MTGSTTLPLNIALLISLISLSSSIDFQGSLIHSNSPRSPLYNPKAMPSDRIKASVTNSLSRHRYLEFSKSPSRASPDWVQAPMRPHGIGYVMSYYIGSPATETFGIADTASELIWLQCLPCDYCFDQKLPIFDPIKSSSYRKIKCGDPECQTMDTTICRTDYDICSYSIGYEDYSSSAGDFSSERMIFSDNRSSANYTLLNMLFGCGHSNVAIDEGADNPPGMIGLNNQSLSFLSQIMLNEFSYCLVPIDEVNGSSPIHFGLSASIVGGMTPILDVGGYDGFYYLGLEGISVENEKLPIPVDTFTVKADGSGGFIIDSGTTYSILNSTAHDMLIKEVANKTSLPRVDDTTEQFQLCYNCSIQELDLTPDITFHFTGVGVDLLMTKTNTWTDNGEGLYCLAILPTDGFSIMGTHQQQNINIGYDVMKRVVSFKPMDCTKPPA
ncbi:hypothetical protein HHK36_011792 [Tetracentron sinense]|uniref:Peptidase A1 domain-containing protein n=1 Tax=Tetracentron sinense TaxID=13715 RepID=A0A834ZEG6_TETSI|nr:hypothetical protein HHK36_011792 [Tetracentron sinense]